MSKKKPYKEGIIKIRIRILVIQFSIGLILIFLGVILNENIFFSLTALTGVVFLFTIYFFRNPGRILPHENGIVIAPADGYIVQAETVPAPEYREEKAVLISIFLALWDVHVNRIPFSGTVLQQKYHKGSFHFAFRNKSSALNEHNSIYLETSIGMVIVKQISGAVVRRIISYVKKGDQVQAGDPYGMIVFGSRVDLFLPVTVKIRVQKGDHVKAGQTIIGVASNEP